MTARSREQLSALRSMLVLSMLLTPAGRCAVVVGLLAVQPPRPGGYLVVGANAPPAESERFLLQVLAQQAAEAELRAAALG